MFTGLSEKVIKYFLSLKTCKWLRTNLVESKIRMKLLGLKVRTVPTLMLESSDGSSPY